MKLPRFLLIASLLTACSALSAAAADLAGKWTAEFDTQIGVQKYVYTFKAEGDKLTGTATFDHSYGQGTVALKDIKVEGDQVSFAEPFEAQGMTLTITYSGTLTADEMELDRHVGDFATEKVVAHRAPATE